jgi:hypothetical protein
VGLRDKSRDWKTCHGSSTHYMEMLSRGEARIRTRVSGLKGRCLILLDDLTCHTTSAHLVKQSSTKRHSAGQGHPPAKETMGHQHAGGRSCVLKHEAFVCAHGVCCFKRRSRAVQGRSQRSETQLEWRRKGDQRPQWHLHCPTSEHHAGPAHSPGATDCGEQETRSQCMQLRC